MYGLAKLQMSSSRNIINIKNPKHAELNEQQRRVLNTAAKYTSLLSVALICSIPTIMIILINGLLWDEEYDENIFKIMWLWMAFDCFINLVCLWLQFNVAEKYYKRYCMCCGNVCKWIVTGIAGLRMK